MAKHNEEEEKEEKIPEEVREWLSKNGKAGGAVIRRAMAEFRKHHPNQKPGEYIAEEKEEKSTSK